MTNREKATLIWLGIALIAAMWNRELRVSLWDVVRAFAHPKLVGVMLAFAAWTVGLVALAHSVELWKPDVRNDTLTWFITVGVALFFSFDRVAESGFFRQAARRAVAVTVFVEGFANLEVFGLAVELVLLPILAVVGVLGTFVEGTEQYAAVRRVINQSLVIVGLCILGNVSWRLASDFNAGHTLRALVLPAWLAIGCLPFIYICGLLTEYRRAFARIDRHTDNPSNRRRAKWALLRAAHLGVSELAGFSGHWIGDVASAESSADAHAVMRRWRETWRSERRAERLSNARAFMREWLTQRDPTLAKIHADTLRRSWERLDREQRADLKAEGTRLARNAAADEVRGLPD